MVEVRRIPSLELVARWVGEALRVRSIDEHARVLAYSFAEADGGEGGFVVLER